MAAVIENGTIQTFTGGFGAEHWSVDGDLYRFDAHGVLHQVDPRSLTRYDVDYVKSRYDTLPDRGARMSFLRAGFIIGATGRIAHSVLDVGYGNGSFLRCMGSLGAKCAGLDISGYPVPEGCRRARISDLCAHWDLVTMFDSLEHMPDLEFLRHMPARFVAVTAPWFHVKQGLDWFASWKHRRPGEHLHHFSPESLRELMHSCGYRQIVSAPIEDAIRKPEGNLPNTVTSVFAR
jgi:hypothetical protein